MSEGKHISPVTIVIEFLSIVVAVLAALAVDQWKEGRTNHTLAVAALRGVRRELSINQYNVRSRIRYHKLLIDSLGREIERLDSAMEAGGERKARMRPPPQMGMVCGISTSPLPTATAWQVVLSTNVLSYLEYKTISTLTETYARQQELTQQMTSTDRSMPDLIAAGFGERPPLGALQNLQIDIVDLRAIERSTLSFYDRAQALLDTLKIPRAAIDTTPRDSLAPCRRISPVAKP